jgi:hypothetical protein
MVYMSNNDENTDSLNEQPLSIEGTVKDNTSPENYKFSDVDKAMAAKLFAGATPTLVGLLSGASPAMAENQIKQSQQYYQIPQKVLLTKGPNGEPIYTDIRETPGKEAYIKPLKPTAAGLSGIQLVNKMTNQTTYATLDKINQVIRAPSKDGITPGPILDPSLWTPIVPTGNNLPITDISGNQKLIPSQNLYGGNAGHPKTLAEGLGSKFNTTQAQAEQGIKNAAENNKQQVPLQATSENINTAMSLLNGDVKDANGKVIDPISGYAGALKTAQVLIGSPDISSISNPEAIARIKDMLDSQLQGAPTSSKIASLRSILTELQISNANRFNAQSSTAQQSALGANTSMSSLFPTMKVPSPIPQPVVTPPPAPISLKEAVKRGGIMTPQQAAAINRNVKLKALGLPTE